MKRVKTGIAGMDEVLNGGIPIHRHIALNGGPGACKTSFSFEYIYRGAQMGENGIYVTLEETPEDIIENMSATFTGFTDMAELISSKKMEIVKPDKFKLEDIAEALEERIAENDIRRAVIDSATMVRLAFKEESEYRQTMFEFFSLLRNLDITAIMTVEAPNQDLATLNFDIEHFVMDGIINLYNLGKADQRIKAVEVYKMRGTDHRKEKIPFKITPDGIKVFVGEKVF
jgi:circadian clock protein KaiC